MSRASVRSMLVATPDPEANRVVELVYQDQCQVDRAVDLAGVLNGYSSHRYDFALVDVRLLRGGALQGDEDAYRKAIGALRHHAPAAELIALCPPDLANEGVLAVRAGARSYLVYPLSGAALAIAVDALLAAARLESEVSYLRDEVLDPGSVQNLRTSSPAMREVLHKATSVAPTRSTVLLTGETGTGKGVLARFIHLNSNRRNAQFIQVHCGAIPETLVESELFGHERGAFTGAVRRKQGKFELAHGGTLFLDEVGTISPAVQIKLLQVLQNRTFQRVGGEKDIVVDVRIVAASNADLRQLVEDGEFRADLYYRLGVFPIEIPPLRERRDDVPLLLQAFLRDLRGQYGKDVRGAEPAVLEALRHYPWPGNIRELENLVERAYVLETSTVLTPASFPRELFGPVGDRPLAGVTLDLPLAQVRQHWADAAEREYLAGLLARHGGRIADTARAAGVGPRQLHKLLRKHDLQKQDYRNRTLSRR